MEHGIRGVVVDEIADLLRRIGRADDGESLISGQPAIGARQTDHLPAGPSPAARDRASDKAIGAGYEQRAAGSARFIR